MATIIRSNDLDFPSIKARLIEFMGRQSEFQDYDFEASGLSSIADVLAFNTHQNALIGNFALNERFIQTAQLRSSVVNAASNFAYTPRSRTASTAYVNVSVNLTNLDAKPQEIYLPADTTFTASMNEVTYTFRTTEQYVGRIDAAGLGVYTFEDEDGNKAIPIKEGSVKTKTFNANTELNRQVYVIPDDTLDISTLKVRVFEDTADTEGNSYLRLSSNRGINADSRIFLVLETYNGFYELNFGDGTITGQAPVPGNIIRATYISSSGIEANGASVFTPTGTVSIGGISYNLSVTTVAKSSLGSEKESLESIRVNAPTYYLSQGRLVTPLDYVSVISNTIPSIRSMNAWGGEDNYPDQKFGKVILSIIYESDVDASTKSQLEQQITTDITNELSMTSIGAEFVDPNFVYLDLSTEVKYDKEATALSRRGLEQKIRTAIATHFSENFGKFSKVFRKSTIQSLIDATDASVLSSKLVVKMQSRLEPVYNTITARYVLTDYTVQYLNTIAQPNFNTPTITSDSFVYNGLQCTIQNVIGRNASTKLQVIDTDGNVVVSSIGEYFPSTGVINLYGFQPTSIVSGQSYIKIVATPADDSVIKPLRNTVIDLGINAVTGLQDKDLANANVGEN